MATIHVDVVSAEESIFSGEAKFVALPGEAGLLGTDNINVDGGHDQATFLLFSIASSMVPTM